MGGAWASCAAGSGSWRSSYVDSVAVACNDGQVSDEYSWGGDDEVMGGGKAEGRERER